MQILGGFKKSKIKVVLNALIGISNISAQLIPSEKYRFIFHNSSLYKLLSDKSKMSLMLKQFNNLLKRILAHNKNHIL